MSREHFPQLFNAQPIDLSAIPQISVEQFRGEIIDAHKDLLRITAMFGLRRDDETVQLFAVLADDEQGKLIPFSTVVGESYPAITPECPQTHLFEREIFEQLGVVPEGHPWLKPVRFTTPEYPSRKYSAQPVTAPVIGQTEFFSMQGEEVHEVAVGPVHAGVIEPGHFRFQCHGENVYHLEISLGYQHRGIEKRLVGGPHKRTVFQMEEIAGDTSIGHTLTYSMVIEALSSLRVSARAQAIRGIALELERLANHVGDLGALAGDVGYLSTSALCGAIRGDFLNMTALICGSRLGRSLVRPGGVLFDFVPQRVADLQKRLTKGLDEVTQAVKLLWESSSVLSRFETTGALTLDQAHNIGLVGPAARACGVLQDVRHDFPSGIYQLFHIPASTAEAGDVYSRAFVRWLEIQRSVAFIQELLESLPAGEIATLEPIGLAPNKFVAALTEGWRGEICHVAITDAASKFARYKVVDPSFHNWFGLALCLRGQAISDFPLCNKSFNLSYCGFDL
jgi:Ni,Fe-hydrogenase III large subunit